MAVTISVADFRLELRLANSQEERTLSARALAYASEAVVKFAPLCPDSIHNEAAVRLGAYVYDMPSAGMGSRYANALRSSGAERAMLPWREHGGGIPADAD